MSGAVAILRDELLAGRTVALAGGVRAAVAQTLSRLGADAQTLTAESEPTPAADALVYDAAPSFGAGGRAGLRDALDGGWSAIAAVANQSLIPRKGGKVVMIAPRPGAGTHAEAARAALENLARTLSVEWARYAITVTAIAPGPATPDEQIGLLVAFVLSVAGDYFKANLMVLNLGPSALTSKDAAYVANELVRPAAVIASHVNEGATSGGKVRPTSRTAAFMSLVKGRPVYPALSGKTMQFNGDGKCVAGC